MVFRSAIKSPLALVRLELGYHGDTTRKSWPLTVCIGRLKIPRRMYAGCWITFLLGKPHKRHLRPKRKFLCEQFRVSQIVKHSLLCVAPNTFCNKNNLIKGPNVLFVFIDYDGFWVKVKFSTVILSGCQKWPRMVCVQSTHVRRLGSFKSLKFLQHG